MSLKKIKIRKSRINTFRATWSGTLFSPARKSTVTSSYLAPTSSRATSTLATLVDKGCTTTFTGDMPDEEFGMAVEDDDGR
jgi:hypothetical protein